jgi:hypothetical protein
VIWVGVLWHLIGLLADAGPTGLLAGSTAVTGLLLLALLAARVLVGGATSGTDPLTVRQGLRELARRTGVPRHRDPDAAGRSRPRAPTAAPTAA